ncbi:MULTISPECIES: TetR/AcrR family transcriptional regulator [Novosphingobium]|nr:MULTISPECIES: TetR/AcrR family transcriptional regulator [unclassified Novosphingobium]KPH65918.1 TetR family transcriptional regulator [Novosphingobium sp. ST904]MPS70051.1 TetR/AcrR family transcriptional regulator [Novosphingobium sp.]WRT95756.1 TetR/AcrR family transcriptional regulator [Novosphingobium sp. RL4]
MGRRSDHSRQELEQMLIVEGHKHMADVGFSRFSAREVAKRIGYSIGTLYNVMGNYDQLIIAINTRTFVLWTDYMREALAASGEDRVRCLVEGYFGFARANRNAWTAIYDHHLPPDMGLPEEHDLIRGRLTDLVVEEVEKVLPADLRAKAPRLARSLVATVHGHCVFDINGSFALMGEREPVEMALARVRESLAAVQAED